MSWPNAARIGLLVASTASCVGGDLAGDFGTAPGPLVSGGVNTVKATHSAKCIDVVANSVSDGALMEQTDCDGSGSQQWTFRNTGSNSWEISSAPSGKCLDIVGASALNGARIQQWGCHGGANQRWRLTNRGGEQYQIQSVASGKCLDVSGVSTASGALLQQWTCAGSANQTFLLSVTAPGTGTGGSGGGGTGGSGGSSGTGGATGSGGTSGGTGGMGGAGGGPLTGPGHVTIQRSGSNFTLLRDGQPYLIRGIAGGARLDLAQKSGANSLRTYSSSGALRTMDGLQPRGMTLLLGIGLSSDAAQYTNEAFKTSKRTEVSNLLAQVKNHPALLMWALGNEINLGADTQAAWEFVNELAAMIHQQDPNHPVMTVIAGENVTAMNHVAQWAPQIDLLGINAYKRVPFVDAAVKSSRFTGPYAITEFGPTGHWETTNTTWNRPIEQPSGDKALSYQQRYEAIVSHRDRAVGSYVFLWAQKQERTPTWYGMFLETLPVLGLAAESCPTVDAMSFVWSGVWPSNRAPNISALAIDGKRAEASVTLAPGAAAQGQVTVSDPEGDPLKYVWEILEDSDLMSGGSPTRPARVGAPLTGTTPNLTFTAPTAPGFYRLYVYVLDGKGHAGTANVPFRVM